MSKYEITAEQNAQLENAFSYHPPHDDQPDRYIRLRSGGKTLAEMILANAPPGRERALAMTKLEEAIMWANAAIARGEA